MEQKQKVEKFIIKHNIKNRVVLLDEIDYGWIHSKNLLLSIYSLKTEGDIEKGTVSIPRKSVILTSIDEARIIFNSENKTSIDIPISCLINDNGRFCYIDSSILSMSSIDSQFSKCLSNINCCVVTSPVSAFSENNTRLAGVCCVVDNGVVVLD